MSMVHQLTDEERQKLCDWLPHAEKFGYRTSEQGLVSGEHSRHEQRLHSLQYYSAVSGLSDNLFRNIVQLSRDSMLLEHDVMGKATQVEQCLLGNEAEICRTGGHERKLLKHFFKVEAEDLADEIEELYDSDKELSVPFEIIILSGLALMAIAFDTHRELRKIANLIVTLKDEYEDQMHADAKEDSDSDYKDCSDTEL